MAWSTVAIIALALLLFSQWVTSVHLRRQAFKWRGRWLTARFGLAVHGTEGDYYQIGIEAGGGRAIIFRRSPKDFPAGQRVRQWSHWMGASPSLSTGDMPDEQSLGLNE